MMPYHTNPDCAVLDAPSDLTVTTSVAGGVRPDAEREERGALHNGVFSFAWVRRAVEQQDEASWSVFHDVFQGHVVAWCRQAGGGPFDDLDELASCAWIKFWRNYTAAKLNPATGIGGVLSYLKLCARSAVIDAARRRHALLSLEQTTDGGADLAQPAAWSRVDDEDRVAFWETVQRHLRSERERVLVRLMFVEALRPAEIQARRPDLFPLSSDVYRVTRNVLDRLRRSREMRLWLEPDDDSAQPISAGRDRQV